MSQNRFRREGRNQGFRSGGGSMSSNYGVNPWEGGMVPGRGGNGLAGLLPTPNQGGSLLGQLSTQEAQLAIASNLLNTLLRPQQQQQNQVPSLLSLGSGGNMGGGGYGQQFGGRYGDIGPSRYKSRSDVRSRNEPYSKLGNRSGYGRRSQSKGSKDSSDRKSNLKGRESSKQKEDGNEDGKKADGDSEMKEEHENESDDGSVNSKGEKKSPFEGLPKDMYVCHVCTKNMWDAVSFENHLKGRTHQLLMEKLDESYRIRVELMRHESKVYEQQREIEIDRMKRQGKKVHFNNREYCTMCDLHFVGNLAMHRKNDKHQQLKAFLHPKCVPCNKEFPTRIEWDQHKLTASHLKMASSPIHRGIDDDLEAYLSNDGFRCDAVIKWSTAAEEEADIIKPPAAAEIKQEVVQDGENAEEGAEQATPAPPPLPEPPMMTEETMTIMDDDDKEIQVTCEIPEYSGNIAYGKSVIKKVYGHFCRTCHHFFLSSEDAKVHCRTKSHYDHYIELLRTKAKAMALKEKELAEARLKREAELLAESEKEKALKEEKEMTDDETNWKRRKLGEKEGENSDKAGEVYDPMEEEGADQDDSVRENGGAGDGKWNDSAEGEDGTAEEEKLDDEYEEEEEPKGRTRKGKGQEVKAAPATSPRAARSRRGRK